MEEAVKTYVKAHLQTELEYVRQSFSKVMHLLTDEEKAVVYKYTCDDGTAERVNGILRQKIDDEEFADYLDWILAKLPNLNELVYRGVYLNNFDIEKYQQACQNRSILIESAFVSTSLSKEIAACYGNVLFKIFSKTGKLIENISKFGSQTYDNEQEVS